MKFPSLTILQFSLNFTGYTDVVSQLSQSCLSANAERVRFLGPEVWFGTSETWLL